MYFLNLHPASYAFGKKNYLPLWDAMLGGHLEIVEIFIGLGADPDIKCTSDNFTGHRTYLQYLSDLPICEYSMTDHQLAKVLIRHGAEIHKSNSEEIGAPLFFAIIRGNLKLVQLFMENGAKFDKSQWDGISPAQVAFHIEIDLICKGMLQLLIKNGFVDGKYLDDGGNNLLHIFMDSTHIFEETGGDAVPEIAEILLNLGIPVDAPDSDGDTPLHNAISPLREYYTNFDVELAKLFVRRGANVNLKSESTNKHPLSLAVMEGNKELINFLLDNGANVHAKENEHGFTALHIACMYHEQYGKEIIELLIRRGADIKEKDNKGRTPFQLIKIMKYNNSLKNSQKVEQNALEFNVSK